MPPGPAGARARPWRTEPPAAPSNFLPAKTPLSVPRPPPGMGPPPPPPHRAPAPEKSVQPKFWKAAELPLPDSFSQTGTAKSFRFPTGIRGIPAFFMP